MLVSWYDVVATSFRTSVASCTPDDTHAKSLSTLQSILMNNIRSSLSNFPLPNSDWSQFLKYLLHLPRSLLTTASYPSTRLRPPLLTPKKSYGLQDPHRGSQGLLLQRRPPRPLPPGRGGVNLRWGLHPRTRSRGRCVHDVVAAAQVLRTGAGRANGGGG